MGMHAAPLEGHQPLSASQIADLRLAASNMTGSKWRAFEAEMAVKHCGGNPLLAETLCGWGRQTVALGLAERRTGIMCLGAQSAFSGRKRWENEHPDVAADLRRLAEAHAQQDPTFRTTLAYTRLTAKAALAVSPRVSRGPTAGAFHHGRGAQSSGFSVTQSAEGQTAKKRLPRPTRFLPIWKKRPGSHGLAEHQTLEYRL